MLPTKDGWCTVLIKEVYTMPRSPIPDEQKAQKVSISFDPEQLKEVLEYCQKNERSMAWVIRKALADWLPKHREDSI